MLHTHIHSGRLKAGLRPVCNKAAVKVRLFR